jgi:hypothetical protein
MLSLMLFLLFDQTISKEQFVLIEKDSISFSKLINQLPKSKVSLSVIINANQEECFT